MLLGACAVVEHIPLVLCPGGEYVHLPPQDPHGSPTLNEGTVI